MDTSQISLIRCSQCWDELTVAVEHRGHFGVRVGSCPDCATTFQEPSLDEIQMKMAEGKVPVVEPLRAARLLKRPGEPDWVIEQLKGVLVLSDNRYCIRLPDIRAYADRMGIRISATNAPTVWA